MPGKEFLRRTPKASPMNGVTARRKVLGVALALVVVAGTASPARASLWSGACALRLTIDFESAVRPPLASPNYTLSATGAADLDVLTPGVQPCAVTLADSNFSGTAAGGTGSALAWSCAGTVANGWWEQSFGAEGPDGFTGSHVLSGAWGAWTLHVQTPTPNVVGVGEFTLDPSDATKTLGCGVGSLGDVTMVGVLVFQDP